MTEESPNALPDQWALAKWRMVEIILDEGKAVKVSREGGAVVIEDLLEEDS